MNRSVLLLLCAAALSACDEIAVQNITAPLPETSARIKFFNFGVGSPGVNFYANDAKMTAISSATGQESTVGVNYGAAASGALYVAIPAGQYTVSGRIAAAVDKDLPISNVQANLQQGKAYSFYQSGIYNTTAKTVDAFVVEDPVIQTIDYSVAYVRFVHAVSNAEPMTLHATHTVTGDQQAIGAVVAYKAGGAFAAIPTGPYNLATRYAGGSANVLTRANVSFAPGRIYTITARGNITVASTQLLDNTLNR